MSRELSENVLGIDLDGPEDGPEDETDDETESLERFVFVTIGEHRLAVPVDAVKNTTGVPTELTPVPRSSAAIEGVTDLRGEITAVIEPRVHFPTEDEPTDRKQLLVLDRPADDQPAALRVDAVEDIESVPRDNVHRQGELEDDDLVELDIADNALEHPLLVGVVIREERADVELDDVLPAADSDDRRLESTLELASAEDGEAGGDDEAGFPSSRQGPNANDRTGTDTVVQDVFALEDEEPKVDEGGRAAEDVSLEVTALLDVERLLLASGHTEAERSESA